LKDIDVACGKEKVLEIGEMVIFAFIRLVGLGPATSSRVFTFLLDSLLTATTKIPICPI